MFVNDYELTMNRIWNEYEMRSRDIMHAETLPKWADFGILELGETS